MLRIICLLVLAFVVPVSAIAEITTFHETHTYLMGDNDSKNDARRICFLEVKRKILEKAGVYVESRTNVSNYQLIKDDISAYAAAMMTVGIEKEEWKASNDTMSVTLSVKAVVDMDSIRSAFEKINKDDGLRKRIAEQQDQLEALEQRLSNLQKQLEHIDGSRADALRDERDDVFKHIENIRASSVYEFWK
ncbi:MAG: hypothetical protein SWH61_17610 [Thermodesulfobacteriota bacterium]|nr:hypothetical protein [Thermodesulfobacteriota bacterium]